MWTHNLYIWIKFVPLYKGITWTFQEKYTNYTNGVQDCLFWRISIDFELFFLSSKGCTLSCHTFIHHTLISYTLFDLHITIGILTPLMMFEEKFSFRFFIIFWTKSLETLFTRPMRTHNLCMGMIFVPL